ncbi:hypothetical protein Bca4012_059601 [Brassica carinata]
MGKTRGMGTGRWFPYGRPPCDRPFRRPSLKERRLRLQMRWDALRKEASLRIQSDKSLKRTDQDQTSPVSGIDIQEKLSPDVVSSTSKPQTTSSRLSYFLDVMKKTLASQVSLLRCSACMQIIQSDKGSSDQDQTPPVSQIDIQEKLSSDIVSSISKTHQGKKHLRSISKMRKSKAFLKKKIRRAPISSGTKPSSNGKLSSDAVTSTSKPQTPSSRLASQCGMKRTLGSEVSLPPCSTRRELETNQSDTWIRV